MQPTAATAALKHPYLLLGLLRGWFGNRLGGSWLGGSWLGGSWLGRWFGSGWLGGFGGRGCSLAGRRHGLGLLLNDWLRLRGWLRLSLSLSHNLGCFLGCFLGRSFRLCGGCLLGRLGRSSLFFLALDFLGVACVYAKDQCGMRRGLA